jgi:predicted small secreted protein
MKRKLLGLGIIVAGVSMLSACHTVQGTVQGAGKDIDAVATAVTPSKPVAKKTTTVRHKKAVKKKVARKKVPTKTTTTQDTTNSAPADTSTTTSTDSSMDSTNDTSTAQ